MTVRYPDSCLVQFAKAPILGRVKTRMQSALGEAGCLSLHSALVEHQFCLQHEAVVSNFELWCSAKHNFFDQLVGETDVPVCVQQGLDLGERMHNVFIDRLRQYPYVVIVGSDCPSLGGEYIAEALDRLKQGVPAVFGPATDGGYVLIGLSRVNSALFDGVCWGSDQVMEQTRERLKGLGWQWDELPSLPDIDRPEDLQLLSNFTKLNNFLL